jgi:hypothetical protein
MEREAPYLFLLLIQELAGRALDGERVDPDLPPGA